MVMNELRGEKIDIIKWTDEKQEFVANALSPAKVKEVRILEDGQTALVIVPDYQLSLAIGKEGQNARLARAPHRAAGGHQVRVADPQGAEAPPAGRGRRRGGAGRAEEPTAQPAAGEPAETPAS